MSYRPELNELDSKRIKISTSGAYPDWRIKGFDSFKDLPKPKFLTYQEFMMKYITDNPNKVSLDIETNMGKSIMYEPYHPRVLNAKLTKYGWKRFWDGFFTGIIGVIVVSISLVWIIERW